MNSPSPSSLASEEQSRYRHDSAPLFGLAACAVGFALVVVAAYGVPRIEQADAAALAGLFRIESTRLDYVVLAGARSADLLPWLAGLMALGWCGLRWGRGRQALAGIAAAFVAVAASQVLKALLAHPRLQAVVEGDVLGPEALPSGHATAAMSLAVLAVLCAPSDLQNRAIGLGAFYAWLVGVCLVILAWHLPSDVMAAMLLAAGCGFASLLFAERLPVDFDRSRRSAPTPVLAGAALVVLIGIAAFVYAVATGGDRAGEALAYANANRSAAVAVIAIGVLPGALLTILSRVAHRSAAHPAPNMPEVGVEPTCPKDSRF